MNGRLGAFDLIDTITQSIAVCSTDKYATVTVNLCNRSSQYTAKNIRIAITDSESAITENTRYLEYGASLAPNSSYIRSGVIIGSNQYLTVYYESFDARSLSAVAWGVQVGDDITVAPITIQLDPEPTWITSQGDIPIVEEGQPVEIQLQATDNRAIAGYSIVAGTLPTGLALDGESGIISGVPTGTDDDYPVTVRATDVVGVTADQNITITKVPDQTGPTWTINSSSFPQAQELVEYPGFNIQQATDVSGPITYTQQSGTLPAGMTFDVGTGNITGTAERGTAGTANLVFRATDAVGNFSDLTVAFVINTEPQILTGTGGSVSTQGDDTVHTYTSAGSDTFVLTESNLFP